MKKGTIKYYRNVLYFILLNLVTSTTYAQWYDHLPQEEKEQKSIAIINEVDCLVAATPVSSMCFYGEDGKTIYTKIKIRVNHWYKGEGKRFIYLTRKGGVIGDDYQVSMHRTGPSMSFGKDVFLLLFRESENYRFGIDSRAFYGRFSDTYTDDFFIKAFYGMKFDSIESFHDFIKNLQGIKVSNQKEYWAAKISNSQSVRINEKWLASLGTLWAGVGEILIIKGYNFGKKGSISLSAKLGNLERRSIKLKSKYIRSWTPTEIQVIIPAEVLQGLPPRDDGVIAYPCEIIVRRKLLRANAPNYFTISDISNNYFDSFYIKTIKRNNIRI